MNAILTYVIRNTLNGKMAEVANCQGACHEGLDGKQRAQELVAIHNEFYPNATWYVSEECI